MSFEQLTSILFPLFLSVLHTHLLSIIVRMIIYCLSRESHVSRYAATISLEAWDMEGILEGKGNIS